MGRRDMHPGSSGDIAVETCLVHAALHINETRAIQERRGGVALRVDLLCAGDLLIRVGGGTQLAGLGAPGV